jgi:hypothetical protein
MTMASVRWVVPGGRAGVDKVDDGSVKNDCRFFVTTNQINADLRASHQPFMWRD